MKIEHVLIVDDDPLVRDFLKEALEEEEIEVHAAPSGPKAIEILRQQNIDLVLTDMQMPKMNGLQLIEEIKREWPRTLVAVITAYGSIENAVEAMRLGAYTYLLKPFTADTAVALIEKANEYISLIEENRFLRGELAPSGPAEHIVIGNSSAIREIMETVKRVAKSNASVFIHGESGTGKEVIAEAIHLLSPRSERPFIKVNCAALPETLIESEFFGHEKGSFTGAAGKRLGRFELANNGTLLLDEISEIPLSLQAKLLRVTQEQEFERIGGSKPIRVDVRIISTSNREVEEMLKSKVMREDLFYRLNVVPIYLPPLRERKEDIEPLAEYFLDKLCKENHRALKKLSKDAVEKLLAYQWPGNVRELGNILERAIVIMDEGDKVIKPENLTIDIHPFGKGLSLREIEKRLISEALKSHGQNASKAAGSLGIDEATLLSKMREHKI